MTGCSRLHPGRTSLVPPDLDHHPDSVEETRTEVQTGQEETRTFWNQDNSLRPRL